MNVHLKVARRVSRQLDRQDAYDRALRPLRLLAQSVRMTIATLRRNEFDGSLELDHRIMLACSRPACDRYIRWVGFFRKVAHRRSL